MANNDVLDQIDNAAAQASRNNEGETTIATNAGLNVNYAKLLDALKSSVKPSGGPSNGGLDNHMWAAVVDRMGVVKAVCYSGSELGDQWPGSRPSRSRRPIPRTR
jgi:hypothetical protein